ncbi:MAG: S8 family serine peptidase, partial [Pseudomonadota bacterium]
MSRRLPARSQLRRTWRLGLLLAGLALAAGAGAQGRGQGVGLGGGVGNGAAGVGVGVTGLPPPGPPAQLPSLPDKANAKATVRAREVLEDKAAGLPPGLARQPEALAARAGAAVSDLGHQQRRDRVQSLVMTHPERLSFDPQGEPVVRGEAVLYDPAPALLQAARDAGFTLARERRLPALGIRVVVLAAPQGLDSAAALTRLRQIDPAAVQGFNHLYLPSGRTGSGSASVTAPRRPAAVADRIGLIDGGLDSDHPALRGLRLRRHGCDEPVPSAHGTATASLLAGHAEGFSGAVRARQLFAADVYCGQPTGGALDAVLEALAWMAQEKVPVINISLVGPPNPLLERVVAQMNARGHLLVAAVGNDGPAAPPLYPAAYPGVVGVSAVDPRRRVLPEAAQGPQVMLAAPGAELAVAAAGRDGYSVARGTSFAAPLVAGLL